MSKRDGGRGGHIFIIFIEVLILVLLTGFGILFCMAKMQGDGFGLLGSSLVSDKSYDGEEKAASDGGVVPVVEKISEKDLAKDDYETETVSLIEEEIEEPGRYGELLKDTDYCANNHIYAREAANPDEVSLLFAGDVGLAEGYANLEQLLQRGGNIETAFNENTLDVMRGADIFMVNNEFTYTSRGVPTPDKTYTFRCNPMYAKYIEEMGADVVSLANNHTYDYGEVSILDTLDTLENLGMPYVGAGRNIEEAIKPAYFIINDVRIAIVSATQIERVSNPDTRGATESSPGTFRCFYDDKVCEVIGEAAKCSDYVIAYIHWGTELEVAPDWAQLELAPKLQAAGANLIIGDHPHILQKIDYIGDTPLIYSLGNYWFNSKELDTGLFEVVLSTSENGLDGVKSVRFIPAIQSGCRSNIVTGDEKARIIGYMRSISSGVDIDDDGYVYKK